jgi:CRISPR-associated protein Cas5d
MDKPYTIHLEISGPSAMWTRPDTGDAPVSYPAPTYSAVKGIFESILWIQSIDVVPTKVEICSPVTYHTYTTNYGGPLRKSKLMNNGSSFQLLATVLINVCYRLYANIRLSGAPDGKLSEKTKAWTRSTLSPQHAYQEIFFRRLKRGQNHVIPCLGWKEFVPTYVGPFREETRVFTDINVSIPSMLYLSFSEGLSTKFSPSFRHDLKIEKGALSYAE